MTTPAQIFLPFSLTRLLRTVFEPKPGENICILIDLPDPAQVPVTGESGELGFGTQELPVSGRDIEDEKILGTLHVATGRSDHLGGHLTPDKSVSARDATHDDILFSPTKTPEMGVPQVRMLRAGRTEVVLEAYQPAAYLRSALAS